MRSSSIWFFGPFWHLWAICRLFTLSTITFMEVSDWSNAYLFKFITYRASLFLGSKLIEWWVMVVCSEMCFCKICTYSNLIFRYVPSSWLQNKHKVTSIRIYWYVLWLYFIYSTLVPQNVGSATELITFKSAVFERVKIKSV